jgi:hypothetical protein
LNFNIRTGDGRLPPKKDTAMVTLESTFFLGSSVPASTETSGFQAFSPDLGNSSLINDFHDKTTNQA